MSGVEPVRDVGAAVRTQPANARGVVAAERRRLAELELCDPHRCFEPYHFKARGHRDAVRPDAADDKVPVEPTLTTTPVLPVEDQGRGMIVDAQMHAHDLGDPTKLLLRQVGRGREMDVKERCVGRRSVAHQLHRAQRRRKILRQAVKHLDTSAWVLQEVMLQRAGVALCPAMPDHAPDHDRSWPSSTRRPACRRASSSRMPRHASTPATSPVVLATRAS